MEFIFEKGECDNDFYHKIQIKNNFVIFFGETIIRAYDRKQINGIKIAYFKNSELKGFSNPSSKNECDSVHIEFLHEKPTTLFYFYIHKNYERLDKFINFILLITDDIPDKTHDIFDFLIGQKRFEENKDSL